MTDLLERAVATARGLSPDMQDEIARVVLMMAHEDKGRPVPLTAGDRAAIARSKAAAGRGEFATDEQLRAIWAKHGV